MTRRKVIRRLLGSLAILMCGLSTVGGQEPAAAVPLVQKVIRLEHMSAQQAQALVTPLLGQIQFSIVPELGILSVRGPESTIVEIERVLKEFDVPRPEAATPQRLNVVFTGYLIGASDSQESPIPEQVQDAVTEMRRHFPYKYYKLLETFGIRTQVGAKAELSGLTSTGPDQPAMRYQIEIQMGDVSENGMRRIVRIRDLRSGWRIAIETKPETFVYEEPELRTSLDVPEGVTVVVGKSGSVGAYQGIFLLLKAEVVEP